MILNDPVIHPFYEKLAAGRAGSVLGRMAGNISQVNIF